MPAIKKLLQDCRTSLKREWGLLIVVIILTHISLVSIRPNFYLAGWDNFSASLAPSLNLKRTVTATWREYRGLGVPSDSEVADTFRQLFFILMPRFLNQRLLEQIYLLLCLNVGVLAMFYSGKKITKLIGREFSSHQTQLAGLIAAFFYLFNLNTLSTFYLPMLMYVSRFPLFPLVILFWLHFLETPKVTGRLVFLFLLGNLFFSAAYVTATVFVTLVIMLGLIILANFTKLKRNLVLAAVFLLINCFWLLPFANYTLEKSSLIPRASTFIEANEIQLNRLPDSFSWEKILTFYPIFFYTRTTDIMRTTWQTLHPLVLEMDRNPWLSRSLLLLPGLAFLGMVLIFFKLRKTRLFWLPVLALITLILLRQEYPPFGFIYNYLGNKIPLYKIVFRFGGEKFNPLLLIACSLSAALFTAFCCQQTGKKKILRLAKLLFILPLLVVYFYPFRYCFQRNLVSPLVYTQIPEAYFEIAETINQDPEYGRVLHLPENLNSYWKPYSWGYVGSTFLGFMLDKPLIEKTFLPASLENDHFINALFESVANAQSISNESALEENSRLLFKLLAKTQVKYIIWDESITKAIPLLSQVFWGTFAGPETRLLLENLEKQQLISQVSEQEIDLRSYLDYYLETTFFDASLREKIKADPIKKIKLYKTNAQSQPVLTAPEAARIDPNLENLFGRPFIDTDQVYIQEEKKPFKTLPFQQTKAQYQFTRDQIEIGLPYRHDQDIKMSFPSLAGVNGANNEIVLEISAQISNENLEIQLVQIDFPQLPANNSGQQLIGEIKVPLKSIPPPNIPEPLVKVAGNWHVLPETNFSSLRLAIDGLVLPLPVLAAGQTKNVGTVLLPVKSGKLKLEILGPELSVPLGFTDFYLTDNPNCYLDQRENYQFQVDNQDQLSLTTQNGTTCLTKYLENQISEQTPYAEFLLTYSFNQKETIPETRFQETPSRLQKAVRREIDQLPTANYFNFCLVDQYLSECLNNHRSIEVSDSQNSAQILIPAEKIFSHPRFQILLALPTLNYQQNQLIISSLVMKKFQPLLSQEIEIQPDPTSEKQFKTAADDRITLVIPKFLSDDAYFFQPGVDAHQTFNQPCSGQSIYRTTKKYHETTFFYNENCQNGIALPLPFDSGNFYLWQADYYLYSGKYPRFVLEDPLNQYKTEYLSLYLGYPEITGFKNLQRSDPFVLPQPATEYADFINRAFSTSNFETAFTYLYPRPEFNDQKNKVFTIEQNTWNQGLFAVKDLNLVRLPSRWQELTLENGPSQTTYQNLAIYNPKKILPSLWRLDLDLKAESPAAEADRYLLIFNQGYDQQWEIYRGSILDTLLGQGKLAGNHLKANGWANGWEIESGTLTGPTTVYLFYTPERLGLIGWLVTLLTLVFSPLIVPRLLRGRSSAS